MKKIITMLAVAGALVSLNCGNAQAQQTSKSQPTVAEQFPELAVADSLTKPGNKVLTKGFWANWSIAGAIGTQFYYGENDKYMNFLDRWTFPSIDLYLNKWVSPSFGWGLAFNGIKMKGLYQVDNAYAAYCTDEYYGEHYKRAYNVQKGYYANPFVYVTLNLSSIFGGYKADRFFNLEAFAGGGIAIGFDEQFTRTAPTFNAGFHNKFRLSDKLDAMIDLRGALVGDDFEGESRGQEPLKMSYIGKNIPLDGIFGISVGLAHRFGGRSNQVFTKADEVAAVIEAQESKIERLEAEGEKAVDRQADLLAQLDKQNEELRILRAQPKAKDFDFRYHINFDLDKIILTNREIIDLEFISQLMKLDINAHKTYYLIGYADKQTGSADHNVWLSQHRVDAVYDCLVNTYGVNPEQIVKSYEGGVDTMFLEDSTLSRCVVIYSEGAQK